MSTEDPTTPPDGVGPVPPPPLAPPVYVPPPPYVPPPAYTPPPPLTAAPLYGTPSATPAGPSLYDAVPEDTVPEAAEPDVVVTDTVVTDTPVPDAPVPAPPGAATPASGGAAGATTPPAAAAGSTGAQPGGAPPVNGTGPAEGRRRNPAAPASVLLGFTALVVALGPAGGGTVMAVLMAAGAFLLGVVAGVRAINGAGRGAAAGAVGAFVAVVAVVVAIGTVIAAGVDGDESSDAQDGADPDGVVQEDLTDEDGDAAGFVSPTDVRPLVVAEVAHGPHPELPDAWWYVVVIDNPNPEHVFPLAEIFVDAVDAEGTLLLSRGEYVDAVPGSVAVTGTFHDLAGLEPAHVEVRVPVLQDVEHAPDGAPLTTGDVTATASSWGVSVEGVVRSEAATDLDMARVVVVARSPDGRILGGARGYVDKLRAGGEGEFDADFFVVLPEDTQYTAYASP